MEKGTNGTPGAAIVVPFTNRTPGAPCGPRPPSFFHWRDFKDWVVSMINRFIVDLTTKADKVSDGTTGNLVGIGADGNLVDSGLRADGLQPLLTFDATPTAGSLNPVTSGGIKQAIDAATPSDYEQVKAQVEQNTTDITAIEGKIPSQASAQNQLADKAFVNSSIATNTATFRGSYNAYNELSVSPPYPLTPQGEVAIATAIVAKLASLVPPVVPENNDYCFVQTPRNTQDPDDFDPTVIDRIDRYKCTVEDGVSSWDYEWSLNNSSFTADQWAAINSGITSALVTKLGALPSVSELTRQLLAKYEKPSTGIPKTDLSAGVQASLDKADTALQTTGGTMTGGLTVPTLTVGSRDSLTTVGEYSVSEGEYNNASGECSHAEGAAVDAIGECSHAEGYGTRATGTTSHAEGYYSQAIHNHAHAEGADTVASGVSSHAEGFRTIAQNKHEHAHGSCNASHKASTTFGDAGNTLSSIGFGNDKNNRKNAVETMQDGKTFIYGLGGYDGTNPTGTGVQDLATAINSKANASDITVKSVKRNGTELMPDTNGAVDVIVPTKLNDVCGEVENWLGVPGTTSAGKSIKVLAKTVNGVIEGGMTVTGSSSNNNYTTKYRYGGMTVTRNGVATDYLFDSTQYGIARLADLAGKLGNTGDQTLSGDLTLDDGGAEKSLWFTSATGRLGLDISGGRDDSDQMLWNWPLSGFTGNKVLAILSDIYAAVQQIAPAWSKPASGQTGTTYTKDKSLCTYNGVLYQCANTYTTNFNSNTPPNDIYDSGHTNNHWVAKKVSELFVPLTGGEMTGGLTIGGLTINTDGSLSYDIGAVVRKINLPQHDGTLALTKEIPYPIREVALTVASGTASGTLYDRCVNTVSVDHGDDVSLTLPEQVAGKSRDFFVRFVVTTESGTSGDWTIPNASFTGTSFTNDLPSGDYVFHFTEIMNGTVSPSANPVFLVTGQNDIRALSLKAPLASPAFTGTPTAPTPSAGDNSTKVATTAFVQAAVEGATPNLDYVMRVDPETGGIYYTTPDTNA